MTPPQTYTLITLVFSYLIIRIIAADNQGSQFKQVEPGPVHCWRQLPMFLPCRDYSLGPLAEDCRAALNMIPSGRLTFEGGDPPTWSIEPPAQRRKFLPAAFTYRTCNIGVWADTTLPLSLESLARTMYYHVWPAVREATEKVLQQCTISDRVRGSMAQKIMFDEQGPLRILIQIEYFIGHPPSYHVYCDAVDAAVVDAVPVVQKTKRPFFKGCLGCSRTVE
jgi:hypothetical protein